MEPRPFGTVINTTLEWSGPAAQTSNRTLSLFSESQQTSKKTSINRVHKDMSGIRERERRGYHNPGSMTFQLRREKKREKSPQKKVKSQVALRVCIH